MTDHSANLLKGVQLAVNLLAPLEAPDSRAVSDEFVALACLSVGDDSADVMRIINRSLDNTARKLRGELKKAFRHD